MTPDHQPIHSPNDRQVTSNRIESWWRTVTSEAAAIALGFAFLFSLRYLARPLALLILGVTIAAALSPIVAWVEGRLRRTFAILIVYSVLVFIMIGIGWLLIPTFVDQVRAGSQRIPDLIKLAELIFSRTWNSLGGAPLSDTISAQLGRISATFLSLPISILSSLLEILVVLFVSLYGLIEAPVLENFVLSLFPDETGEQVNDILGEMGRAMGGYIRGVLLNGLIVGAAVFIGLSVMGIQYPLVLGLFAGVMEFIPVVGPIIAAVVMTLTALLQSPAHALTVLIFMTVVQQTETHVLVPNIMHSQTEVSPLLAVLALFAGGSLGGLLGAFIAIPLVGALQVLVRRVVIPAIRRRTGAEQG